MSKELATAIHELETYGRLSSESREHVDSLMHPKDDDSDVAPEAADGSQTRTAPEDPDDDKSESKTTTDTAKAPAKATATTAKGK